jgi:orotate phosphoribosyltransferase
MNLKDEFIDFMINAGVLTFGDFVTKSGRKTPFFINTGNYKTGEQISKLGDFYAECIYSAIKGEFDLLYGPAYKGIPLSVSTAISFYKKFNFNKGFCFNRKEEKDHGEGGSLIGMKPYENSKVVIIEDVITAGSSVRESVPIIKGAGNCEIAALIISVDRMEKGEGEKSAVQEIESQFGIKVFPIVTIKEIVDYLYNREINGKILVDDEMLCKINGYMNLYGVK